MPSLKKFKGGEKNVCPLSEYKGNLGSFIIVASLQNFVNMTTLQRKQTFEAVYPFSAETPGGHEAREEACLMKVKPWSAPLLH